VKGKLLEFKSLQVKLLQYLAKIATYYKQDMNHICLIKLVVLKRPGFNHENMVCLTKPDFDMVTRRPVRRLRAMSSTSFLLFISNMFLCYLARCEKR